MFAPRLTVPRMVACALLAIAAFAAMAGVAPRQSHAIIIDPSTVPKEFWSLKVSARGYTQVSWRSQVNRSHIGERCQDWIDEGGSEIAEFITPKSGTGVGALPLSLSGSGLLTGAVTRAAFREQGSSAVAGCPAVCPTSAHRSRAGAPARAADCITAEDPPPRSKFQCPDRKANGSFTVLGLGLRLDRPSLRAFGNVVPKAPWKNCPGPPVSALVFNAKEINTNVRHLRRGGAIFVSVDPVWRDCPGYPRFLGSGMRTCRQRTKLLATVFRAR